MAAGPEPLDLRRDGEAAGVHAVLADLVAGGAALGWVDPPSAAEVAELLDALAVAAEAGDASVRVVREGGHVVGVGWWRRFARPTQRTNADIEKVAVAAHAQGRGLGRALTEALVADARTAEIEVLTLDLRGDNAGAEQLYAGLGFVEYGRLPRVVAIGERRWDSVLMLLDLRPGR